MLGQVGILKLEVDYGDRIADVTLVYNVWKDILKWWREYNNSSEIVMEIILFIKRIKFSWPFLIHFIYEHEIILHESGVSVIKKVTVNSTRIMHSTCFDNNCSSSLLLKLLDLIY